MEHILIFHMTYKHIYFYCFAAQHTNKYMDCAKFSEKISNEYSSIFRISCAFGAINVEIKTGEYEILDNLGTDLLDERMNNI